MDAMEQRIRDAEEVGRFLANESVKRVFQAYEELLFRRWRAATDPAERESLHAQVCAFDGLAASLKAVVDSGERDIHDLERAKRPGPLA